MALEWRSSEVRSGSTMRTARSLAAFTLSLAGFAMVPHPARAADLYADPAHWLCRPGRADACSGELTSTAIDSAGTLSKHGFEADPAAPIDCFYVYPTVSREPSANSDLTAGAEEVEVAKRQFARFGAKCRLYAPLYRQITVAVLDGRAKGADFAMPYGDVLAAWKTYLARDNHGRGVVLIGHSQGSHILVRLLAEEIDGRPIQKQLVSAILTGGEIAVPAGRVVGGTFEQIPLCRAADEAGCVIAYSSYLAALPPGTDAAFGEDPAPGQMDACVDPTALLGHPALQAELPAVGRIGAALGTTFVENPGQLSAACARSGGRTYLAVSVGPGGGLLAAALADLQARRPGWGLHALDINLALGDLVELVGRESAAWAARVGR